MRRAAALALLVFAAAGRAAVPPARREKTVDGRTFVFRQGNAYEIVDGEERFFRAVYDPAFTAQNFRREGDRVFRRSEDGGWYPVRNDFREDFEDVDGLSALIGPRRGWSGFTLQSPRAPEIADYVRLRQAILRGQADYKDNRVEPSTAAARTGAAGLRAFAVPPARGMVTSKASLETGLLHAAEGDEFRCSAWFFIARGAPLGLLDLESGYMDGGPGPRVLVSEAGEPRLELKWADKPTYRSARPFTLPRERWFRLEVLFRLYDDARGRAALWVDGVPVIDAAGPTLPLPDTVLDRLEIGVTANPPGSTAEVFVDDVAFSVRAAAPSPRD